MTDKIETNKKPELLKERHNVKTDSGVKEDLNTMDHYEEMAKYYSEFEERCEMFENHMKDLRRKLIEKDNLLNKREQKLDALSAEITSLREALAEAQKASTDLVWQINQLQQK